MRTVPVNHSSGPDAELGVIYKKAAIPVSGWRNLACFRVTRPAA